MAEGLKYANRQGIQGQDGDREHLGVSGNEGLPVRLDQQGSVGVARLIEFTEPRGQPFHSDGAFLSRPTR